MRIITRFKPVWLFVSIVLFGYAGYVASSRGFSSLREILILILSSIMTFSCLFIASTTKVILDTNGFEMYVGFGFYSYEWLRIKYKKLNWNQIVKVVDLFPRWWPFRLIIVSGFDGAKEHSFGLGTFMTNTSSALEILSRYVAPDKIDGRVTRLIERGAKKKKATYE